MNNYLKKYFTLLFFALVFKSYLFSQDFKFSIDWSKDSLKIGNSYLAISRDLFFENKTPKISLSNRVDKALKLKLNNVYYEPISLEEHNLLIESDFIIDTIFTFVFNNKNDQNELFSTILFSAYVKQNGKILRVKNVDFVSYSDVVILKSKRGQIFKSVLADETSRWFKIRVNKKGFYKVTFAQLKKLGFDPKTLGFSSFHVYGNAYGKLPELNSNYVDLDLVQNSVIYEGIADGVFDENDAIVFYSNGPSNLTFTEDSLYSRDLNIYSDYASYFLRVSSNIPAKEVIVKNSNELKYIKEENNYLSHFIHEIEDTSLVYGGKRWYGELLDYDKKLSIPISNFKNQLNQLNISISGATNARLSGSYLNVYIDNQIIDKINLPSVSSEYIRIDKKIKIPVSQGFGLVNIELVRNNPDTKFFLDKIEVNAYKNTGSINTGELFTNPRLIGKGAFKLNFDTILDGSFIVDISKPTEIKKINFLKENSVSYFIDSMNSFKNYIIYNSANVEVVNSEFSTVNYQNLHGIDLVDMIIVSPTNFLKQANELKLLHEQEGLKCIVVTDNEIYNEFSSGEMDPTAIKQFARSVYYKQKNNPKNRLKYLLLFGDGTFDYKNRIKLNNNFLPTYQFDESEDFLSAMVSDDYYGMMDDNESIDGSDLLDIGVGRMLISNQQQADAMVLKIKNYMQNSDVQSDWMSKIALITDDEEGGYFVYNDAEPQSKYLKKSHPEVNIIKLYSDAFQQVTTAGGERYPLLNTLIDNQFYNGALVVSYVGHGGPSGAAEERILTIDQISKYKNLNKLPLFMSSTCEFTKYDDPTRVSAGEVMYLNPVGGAIALMTTTRPVFFGVNTISGSSFYKNVLQYDSLTNTSLTFGEIFRRTKNQSGSSSNRRSFTLIGDPALKINFPTNKIVFDSINKIPTLLFKDTLKALSKVSFTGHVEDRKNSYIAENGVLLLSLFDKPKTYKTLGQDIDSPVIEFENQNSLLFKGLVSVKEGRFNVELILPKDIDYSIEKGKVSCVSNLESNKAIGFLDSILIGGISSNFEKDSIGPKITLSLDSNKVVENGLFGQSPTLYVDLEDESGINLSSSGIGHQISLTLDNKNNELIDLNSYYMADKDTYKKGKIKYPLMNLSEGKHVLKLKAWDVYNNSNEKELQFTINNSREIILNRVFNYPNPFTTKTSFYIEQNNVVSDTDIRLEIFSISGKLVKEFYRENVALRSSIERIFDWDGLDYYGDQLAKGVYIYKITISNQSGSTSKMEKLVIF
jgi:hypothetical protein